MGSTANRDGLSGPVIDRSGNAARVSGAAAGPILT